VQYDNSRSGDRLQNITREFPMPRKKSSVDPFAGLTWEDLEDWAGNQIVKRGRSYQQNGSVSDLARTADGGLIAWVQGSRRYATMVAFDGGELDSNCTCPYGLVCKHAVAVILEYLDRIKKSSPVSMPKPGDERLELLETDWDEDDEELGDEDDSDPDESHGVGTGDESIGRFLEEKTKAELVHLITGLAERNPALRVDILDRKRLEKGHAQPIVKRIRYLIREAGADAGWQDHWRGEGFTPDYSEVRDKLQELLEAGHADDVVALGKELMSVGQDQVGRSDDEGETGMEISACMPVIEKALHTSSMPPVQKLLWVVDALLKDEFDLFDALAAYLDRPHPKADWSQVADILKARLSKFSSNKTTEFGRSYERDRIGDWVISALRKAGREDEVIPLCEKEAPITQGYSRLVEALIEAKRIPEAERWIYAGIKATDKSLPGIAANLRKKLLEIRRRNRDRSAVAALLVDEFVRSPGEKAYADCRRAAEKLKHWDRVRQGLLSYLETGKYPWSMPEWPLPTTGTEISEHSDRRSFPRYSELIDIAIHEKQPDQVIHWYDRMPKRGLFWYDSMEDRVADAARDTHPDRAAAIWKELAQRWIGQVKPKAYREAAAYLRKLRKLLTETGRGGEWATYLAKIRIEHARKRSLIEVLDSLERTPIIKGR
jgi:uncharacterized Zn finger protein